MKNGKYVLLSLTILWMVIWIPNLIQYIKDGALTLQFCFPTLMWSIFGTGAIIMFRLDKEE